MCGGSSSTPPPKKPKKYQTAQRAVADTSNDYGPNAAQAALISQTESPSSFGSELGGGGS